MSQNAWPNLDPAPTVAFIDVDGTLLPHTTTFLYARIMHRRGLIRASFFFRALYHGLQHKFGKLDYRKLTAIGLDYISRIPISELEQIAEQNFVENVKPRLFEGVVEHLESLRGRGTQLLLVSSSPGLVLKPLAVYLGCEDMITTPVIIENGYMTGLGEGPPCYGQGKLFWVEQWARNQNLDLGRAVAYADNWSDRPLLERVGRAVVVRPPRRLAKLAVERGWCIVTPARSKLDRVGPPGKEMAGHERSG
jgi:HAD superfamily hydrolase (TIGR01490 family)